MPVFTLNYLLNHLNWCILLLPSLVKSNFLWRQRSCLCCPWLFLVFSIHFALSLMLYNVEWLLEQWYSGVSLQAGSVLCPTSFSNLYNYGKAFLIQLEWINLKMRWPFIFFVVVLQSLNFVQLFAAPWTAACQTPLSFTIFHSLLKLMSVESVMLSNPLILCHPLLLLPSIFPSIRVFSTE